MRSVLSRLFTKFGKIRSDLREHRINRRSIESTELKSYVGVRQSRGQRACLFASWDPHGRIDPFVIEYLKELTECGFDIYFCTTSSTLDQNDLSVALKYCRVVTHRENVGLDFASWALLWRKNPEIKNYDSVLIANDSVFGPLQKLESYFVRMNEIDADFVGMTDSWEKYYHLQSYFVFCKKTALESGLLDSFLNSVKLSLDKDKIIEQYEVGMSQFAIRNRFKIAALFPYLDIRANALSKGTHFQYNSLILRQPCNSTIFMWDILLREFRFPFLKTEILKINRKESLEVVHWRSIFKEIGIAAQSELLIQNYIARTTANARI